MRFPVVNWRSRSDAKSAYWEASAEEEGGATNVAVSYRSPLEESWLYNAVSANSQLNIVFLYSLFLHYCLINIHIFDYPDSQLSGLFTQVPKSPDNRVSTVAGLYYQPIR